MIAYYEPPTIAEWRLIKATLRRAKHAERLAEDDETPAIALWLAAVVRDDAADAWVVGDLIT